MKYDISVIKNEIAEQTNYLKEKTQQKAQQKTLANLKEEIMLLINDYFTNEDELTLKEIYKQRDNIIDDITRNFYDMTETIPAGNDWLKKHKNCSEKEEYLWFSGKLTEEIKVYNYPYSTIREIVKTEFLKQYRKYKSEYKEEHLILKEDLKQKLIDELKNGINYCIDDGGLPYYVFITFKEAETKNKVINNITNNNEEAETLENIYYQTLNEIKREYDTTQKKYPIKEQKSKKLALSWRIIGYTKAIKTLWKM